MGEFLKEKNDDFVSIKIPRKLFEKLGGKMRKADFETVQRYIIYILEKACSKEEEVYSERDKEKIKERLRRLGYF